MRYIDADKLIKWCNDTYDAQTTFSGKAYISNFLEAIAMCEKVDVVPRAEVEEWKATAEAYQKMFEDSYQAKQEIVREIFEEIAEILKKIDRRNSLIGSDYGELLICDIGCCIGEIKKKHIGE